MQNNDLISRSALKKYLKDYRFEFVRNCDLRRHLNGGLIMMTEIAEAENALAAVSNYDVVFVLRPVARELSELTVHRYVDILDQAREMILEGKDIPDVLCHFDTMLYDLKHGRK